MKKIIIVIFLVVFASYFFITQYSNGQTTFLEFYDLNENSRIRSIHLISTKGNENSNESKNSYTSKESDFHDSEEFYDYFKNIEFTKANPKNKVETENEADYYINLTIESDGEILNFNITIGRSYLLITPMKDEGENIYNHDLTAFEYSNLVERIEIHLNQ